MSGEDYGVAVVRGIDVGAVPTHVAVVMDGNGRWAAERGEPRTAGHEAGEQAILEAIEGALELGVEWLTLYAFSTENWRRPLSEVRFLMNFNERVLERHRGDLHARGVRIRSIGRRSGRVPKRVIRAIEQTEEMTRRNSTLSLTFAFNYGGRAEIVDAVQAIAGRVAAGEIDPERITEATVRRHLYVPTMPEADLVIRTSGEQRISNFLLWEAAYAEWLFPEVLWPDFTREDFYAAVREFQQRERRFGSVSEH